MWLNLTTLLIPTYSFVCQNHSHDTLQFLFKVIYRASTESTVHIGIKCGESHKYNNFQYIPTEYFPLSCSYDRNTCVEYNCVFNIDKFSSFLTKELLDFIVFFCVIDCCSTYTLYIFSVSSLGIERVPRTQGMKMCHSTVCIQGKTQFFTYTTI